MMRRMREHLACPSCCIHAQLLTPSPNVRHDCASSKARQEAARGELQAIQMMSLDDVKEGDYQVQVSRP